MNGHAIIRATALLFALTACAAAPDEAPDLPADDGNRETFVSLEERAIEMSEPRGHIVSRYADGRVEHTGDSRYFMGIALRDFGCVRGAVIRDALVADLEANHWKMRRHPTNAKEITVDPFLSLFAGIVSRVNRCGDEEAEFWRAVFPRLVMEKMEVFDVVRRAVALRLGLGAAPSSSSVGTLGVAMASWAATVKAKKEAAYRIYLGYLALSTLEAAGITVTRSRDAFCAAMDGADMPEPDHWCGRGALAAWIETFELNVYEFRHQRSGVWESADGRPGLLTPALDLLAAMRAVYAPMPLRSQNLSR